MANFEITTIEKEAIADDQTAHFEEVTEQVDICGKMEDIKRLEYKQVIPTRENEARVDTYDGPNGKGYVIVETKVDEKGTWKKSTNYGPEEWRTSNWELVVAVK